MNAILSTAPKPIVYPESDGQPMAENTVQYQYIVTIKEGLDTEYRQDPLVFVAADLFWYPVEGNPTIRVAPDVMVAFGRPKGHRRSYLQWLEGNLAPQVVFEIQSPGNRLAELLAKFQFYEMYGAQEYYLFNPDTGELAGWRRVGERLEEIPNMEGWVSPLLQVRFEVQDGELRLYGRDGRRFLSYQELVDLWERTRDQLAQAQATARSAEATARQAEEEARREKERAERLAARLRALGVDPEQ